MNIFVAGGFDSEDPGSPEVDKEKCIEFAEQLGQAIIEQGHTLISGCQTELDRVVIDSAATALAATASPPEDDAIRVINYVRPGVAPVSEYGETIQSSVSSWDFGGPEPTPPEVIAQSDVVILVGGFFGTFQAANWARFAGKPLLPFSIFGGAARDVNKVEIDRFENTYGSDSAIGRLEYDRVLNSLSENWKELANDSVSLAEKIVTTPLVFVVMPFEDKPEFRDLYQSIQRVCEHYEYEAQRVDESNLFRRIIPEITRQIRQSAFVIADVTEHRPNVFYELGLADGLGKDLIVVAKRGTEMPFDVTDLPVVYWESFSDFEQDLEERVKQIGAGQGRH